MGTAYLTFFKEMVKLNPLSGVELDPLSEFKLLSRLMRFISVFCDLFFRIKILLPCLPAQGKRPEMS